MVPYFNKIKLFFNSDRTKSILYFFIPFIFGTVALVTVYKVFKLEVGDAYADTNPQEWNMAGANPQRTSWITENVPTVTGITWYRPIESYIDQETQIITANGHIYVSTSNGLLVMDAEDGDLLWRFDTELPLGQSPTVVGDMVYVGGLDHKLYALQDLDTTYSLEWTFDEAGFGYTSNPLVVNGTVYIGNRDGYFYAIDATTGVKDWQYPTVGNDPIGAIAQSAAYSSTTGDIYFVSRDMYAYALDSTTGALTWKSAQKLPGERYESWWPVIWQDRVVFTGSFPFKSTTSPGTGSVTCVIGTTPQACSSFKYLQDEDLFPGAVSTSSFYAGTLLTSAGEGTHGWPASVSLMDAETSVDVAYPSLQGYADTYEDRATVVVLDQSTGTFLENAPILFEGTYSGAKYPPIINPTGDTAYIQNYYQKTAGDGISRKITVGWKYGNQYLKIKGSHYAIDEPAALSGMGTDSVLLNLLVDREAVVLGESKVFWNYPATLDGILPYTDGAVGEYDPMWRFYTNEGEYERLKGYYKGNIDSINGIYNSAGQQNPLIPYAFTNGASQRVERMFTHRSNTIIALGPNSNETALTLIPIDAVDTGGEGTPIDETILTSSLEKEIDEILDIYDADNANGFLKPGYYNHDSLGSIDRFSSFYYDNPGDTMLALLQAYPHVNTGLQTRLLTYLDAFYDRYFGNAVIREVGWSTGYDRVDMTYPSEIQTAMASLNDKTTGAYSQRNFYALWKYVELLNDPATALSIYNTMQPYLIYPPSAADISATLHMRSPQKYHEYIQGYTGYLNLQEMALGGVYNSTVQTQRANLTAEIASLESYRTTNFSKDHFIAGTGDNPDGITITAYNRKFNLARNFLFMTPEIGDLFASSISANVQEAVDEYTYVGPWWFVNGNRNSFQEGAMDHLYNSNALLTAKAYVENESQEDLSKYIDAPMFPRGDMMYIQNLVLALEASSTSQPNAVTPVLFPTSSSFSDTISVSLSTTTPGASIYYTTNGTTPTQASTLYSSAITLDSTTTINARAYATGYDPSPVGSGTYTLTVPTPILTPGTGTHTTSVQVDVNPVNPEVTMYYTVDGSTPDNTDPEFTQGVITFTSTTTFKVISYLRGSYSSVATGVYTINTVSGNVAPEANSQYLTVIKNGTKRVLLTFSDDDGPGPYSTTISVNPAHGALSNMGDSDDKTWLYTPTAEYTGSDSFSWIVSDGEDTSNTGVISFSIVESSTGNVVIDHDMVDNQWDDLVADTSMINTIKTKSFSFKHASVGANIWDGLLCLGENYALRPNYCDTNEDGFTGDYYHSSTFSVDFDGDTDIYDNLSFYFHNETPVNVNPVNPNPPWYDKALYFINGVNSREAGTDFDVYSFKFGYVDGATGSIVANEYFNSASSYTNISDVAALDSTYPTKDFVYWTMGLARTIGTTESQSFNTQMRNYAEANNKILMDIADIESHLPGGTVCLSDSGNGTEVICDAYTSETSGGHLNGLAKNRMAKAVWLMMACTNDWTGCGVTTTTNESPQVFAGVDTTAVSGSPINLDGAGVDDGLPVSPGSVTYTWSKQSGPGTVTFGSGSSTDTTATFSLGGTYVLRLTAYDGALTTYDQATVTVSSANVSPTASFTATPTSSTVPFTVTFDASGSTDSDGSISSYSWDFGDSSSGSGSSTTHLYTVAGTYTVILTVTDNESATDTESTTINANSSVAPVVSGVTHSGTGTKYDKYEITFDVTSSVADLNPYLPFVSNAEASLIAGVSEYAEEGITVNGSFQYKGTDGLLTGEPIYDVPAFYYQDHTYNSSYNTPGYDWIYPNGTDGWKLRFTPDQSGVWEFNIDSTDANGTSTSTSYTFNVSDSSNKGFIKVSDSDSRYFEYENGDYFKGLGYTINVSDRNPISDSATVATKMGDGGMDLARFWLSGWALFGGAWAPPYNELSYEDGYLPFQTYTASQHDSDSELSIRMGYYADGNPGNSPMCLLYGGQGPIIAVEPSTTYKVTLKYMTSGVTASGSGGLVVKLDQGVYLVRNTCIDSGFGTRVTTPVTGTSSGWETVSGEITTGASQEFLPNIYVTLDDVTAGSAYIDSLLVEKLDGPGGNVLYQVNPDYSADAHTFFNQRDAYAFDKMLENFEDNGVSLKLVLLEKMDKISRQFDSTGAWGVTPDQNNVYGNTSSPRSDTKVRWLQRSWWRYVQARWGYSPSIHSYELLNEGDPASATHFALADELGKYMQCESFGQSIGSGDGAECTYDHPNNHLVTTSTWHSFPGYFDSANYPNIDYADIHQYVPNTFSSYISTFLSDKIRYYIQQIQPGLSNIDLGNTTVSSISKPVIRGEVGFTNVDTEPYNSAMDFDTSGIWLHDFIWGQLNGGGIMEQYWYTNQQISSSSLDLNHLFNAYSKFIGEENLSAGGYTEINESNVSVNASGHSTPNPRYEQNPEPLTDIVDMDDVIITGLKNVSAGRAVLWVKNVHHNWCVLKTYNEAGVDPGEVSNCDGEPNFTTVPYNFNIVLSGFDADTTYEVEKWDTWTPWTTTRDDQIISTSNIMSDSSGNLTISQTSLTQDFAYKILETFPNVAPTASFTKTPSFGTAPVEIDFDASASTDSDGTIASYSWDFGDTNSGTGVSPSHIYTVPGTYTITLTVTDDLGLEDTDTDTITINAPNVAPTASFTATPTSGIVPLAVVFNASASTDSDGTISGYSWNFGDSSSGSGVNTSHTFTQAGTYTVTLTVSDDDGALDTETVDITVATITPLASFTFSPSSGKAPLLITFDGSGSEDIDGTISTYAWNFGDSTSGSGVSPTHTYTSGGNYTVTLTVTDNDGAQDVFSDTFTVSPPNVSPTSVINQSAVSGKAPLTISFDGSSSSDSDGTISNYSWDFDDGGVSAGATPSHTYTVAGTYSATLLVTDDEGATGLDSVTITVSPANVSPSASIDITSGGGLLLNFDAGNSTDSDGTISSYAWDFGDSSSSTGETTSHTYSADGTYTIVLTVTDDNGATDTDSQTVSISTTSLNTFPVASFTSSVSSGTAPLSVDFDASSSTDSDGTIASYAWDYGDSTSGTGSTSTHIFVTAGTYTVTLSIVDDDGGTDTAQTTIVVSNPSSGGNDDDDDDDNDDDDNDNDNDNDSDDDDEDSSSSSSNIVSRIVNLFTPDTSDTDEEDTTTEEETTITPPASTDSFEIQFVDAEGKPLVGYKVKIKNSVYITDLEGNIRVTLGKGEYTATIDLGDGNTMELSFVLGDSSSVRVDVVTQPEASAWDKFKSNKVLHIILGTLLTALVIYIIRYFIGMWKQRPRIY